jgi:hypothetical protein
VTEGNDPRRPRTAAPAQRPDAAGRTIQQGSSEVRAKRRGLGGTPSQHALRRAAARMRARGDATRQAIARELRRRPQATLAGTAVGVAAAAIPGWGGIGIVAFGTGIGTPPVGATALADLSAGATALADLSACERGSRELNHPQKWRPAAGRRTDEAPLRAGTAAARFARDDEPPTLRAEALREARRSLSAPSASLSGRTVDERFVALRCEALERGVAACLERGYHMPPPRLSSGRPERDRRGMSREVSGRPRQIGQPAKRPRPPTDRDTPTHTEEPVIDGEWLVMGRHSWFHAGVSSIAAVPGSTMTNSPAVPRTMLARRSMSLRSPSRQPSAAPLTRS